MSLNKEGVPYERDFPEAQATLVIADGRWRALPELRGVAWLPIMREDGSLVVEPGFDVASGWMIPDNLPNVDVPAHPSLEQACEAYRLLAEVLQSYEFATDNDKVKAVAFLMAGVLRPSMRLCPMLVADANLPRIGKGHLLRTVALLAIGGEPKFYSPNEREELVKRVSHFIADGSPVVVLDNVNGRFGSDDINTFIGEGRAVVRVYGMAGKSKEYINNNLLCLTGNNVQIADDLATRVIRSRQLSKTAHPEKRTFTWFPHKEVVARSAELLTAVFTLARWGIQTGGDLDALIAAGVNLPMITTGMGFFDEFSCMVRRSLYYVTGYDLADSTQDEIARDRASSDIEVVFEVLHDAFDIREFTAVNVSSWLAKVGRDVEAAERTLKTVDATAIAKQTARETVIANEVVLMVAGYSYMKDSHAIGRWLGRRDGHVAAGWRLVKGEGTRGNPYRFVRHEEPG